MKSNISLGFISIVLFLIGGFIPAAKLNEEIISVFPIWNNFELSNGLWQWKDISFFSVTLALIILFSIYFEITKKYKGFIFSGILSIFVCIIIFIALLQVKSKTLGIENISFSLNWGLMIVLIGGITSIITGVNNKLK